MTPEEPAGIEVGELPTRVAVTPDGRRAFVLNEGSGSVSVVDLAGSTVVATVELPAKPSATRSFTIPKAITVAPDGRSVYVGGSIEGDLRIIDVATNTLRPGQLGGSALPEPDGVAIHPEGGIGFLADPAMRGLRLFDVGRHAALDTWLFLGDNTPQSVVVAPGGRLLYVTTTGCAVLSVDATAQPQPAGAFSAGESAVLREAVVGCDIGQIAITRDGDRLLLVNPSGTMTDGSSIDVLDTAAHALAGPERDLNLPPGQTALGVAISADGSTVYLTNWDQERKVGTLTAHPAGEFLPGRA